MKCLKSNAIGKYRLSFEGTVYWFLSSRRSGCVTLFSFAVSEECGFSYCMVCGVVLTVSSQIIYVPVYGVYLAGVCKYHVGEKTQPLNLQELNQ